MVVSASEALRAQARERVDRVANDSEGRYQLRVDFYEQYGFGDLSSAGYGASELAFLRWEIERGVLNPPNQGKARGSPWWRAVNGDLLYLSELGRLVHEAGSDADLDAGALPAPSRAWVDYIRGPSEQSWYRAHNASIVSGYLRHADLARLENRAERIFLNTVLYRVLYAEAMVEGEDIAFGALGRILADPELPSVETMVSLPDFYPRHYPLRRRDIRRILHEGHSLEEEAVKVLDDVLITPHLDELYRAAAGWLAFPQLLAWLRDGEPAYPSANLVRRHRRWLSRTVEWTWRLLRPGHAREARKPSTPQPDNERPRMTSRNRWTNELLEPMREIGDPTVDDVIAAIEADGDLKRVNRVLAALVENDDAIPEDLPAVVREYFESTAALPDWADPEKIADGERLFNRYGPESMLMLGSRSLPEAYAAEKGAHVLAITGRLLHGVKRRIFETAQFVLDVMGPGGLSPRGRGIRTAQKVRLMHAALRHHIRRDPAWKSDWESAWGTPINQEDMAGTLMTFSTVILEGLKKLEIPLSPEDEEAYIHCWKVVGHVIGVRAELLPEDAADARALWAAISGRQQHESKVGQELTAALIEMYDDALPGDLLGNFMRAMIRFQVGDRLADELAVPRESQGLVAKLCEISGVIGREERDSELFSRLAEIVGRKVLEGMEWVERGGKRASFKIPSRLRASWGLAPQHVSFGGRILRGAEHLVGRAAGDIESFVGDLTRSVRDRIHEVDWLQHQRWENLLFMHYPLPAEQLRPLVPNTLAEWNFHGVPPTAGARRGFAELNLRTYVKVGDRSGVYFFSIDSAAGAFDDWLAREIFNVPYIDSDVSVRPDGDGYRFECRRPESKQGKAARFAARYRPIGEPFKTEEDPFAFWSTERYSMFMVSRSGTLKRGDIHHDPWVLRKAEAEISSNTVAAAAGIELPGTPPQLHHAKVMDVVFWPLVHQKAGG
jgi:uncharacterized protein YqjF (DUF2071 family)